MPPKEADPIEEKSYTKVFFIWGSLFFLVSVWAFYDEFITRRSWKEYQREFNALELKKVQEESEKARQAFDLEDRRRDALPDPVTDESQLSLRRIRLKIEEAELRMESDEFEDVQSQFKEKRIRLDDAKQRYGFAKADQDEVFYEWKHAQEEGKATEAEHFKKEYYEWEEKIGDLKSKVDRAEGAFGEIKKKIDAYYTELKKWKDAEKHYQGPLEKFDKKIASIRARGLDIRQVVLDDLGRGGPVVWGLVDRCESCHVAINQEGFENEKNPFKTHPHRAEIFGRHPIEKFGCATCHGGQGRATQIKGQPLHEGDYVHGFVHHWPEPLLEGDSLQSSCNKCHQDQWRLGFAPISMAGKKLFWDLGCTGCHALKGFEEAQRVGPSLRRVADKVDEDWLLAWIKDPRGYLPHTKMPKPPLDIEAPGQTEKVAAYLLQESERYDFPFGKFPGGNPEEGKKLFETVGCYGCHTLKVNQARSAVEGEAPSGSAGGGGDASPYEDKGSGLAPALDRIAEKTSADWIYNWIRDPKSYSPEARMPSLRLTPREASHITAFLVEQGHSLPDDPLLPQALRDPENGKKGFLLISQFGCYGCHNIKGFEDTSKLSVELTAFGKKDIVELDFGDTHVPRTWEDWTTGKLRDPRMYLTEKTTSKMPNFELTEDQIRAIVIFLKGLRKEEVPERYLMTKMYPHQKEIDDGRRLVERLNCKGCHLIEGEGRLIEAVVGADKAPPVLDGIGARVRPDWMFTFLKDPSRVKLRPWIDARMPTFQFTDNEANTVIRYFSGLDKFPAQFTEPPKKAPDREMVEAGARLVSSDYFSCTSCHIQGKKTPLSAPEQWGPDLALARERIRPEFIPEWVKDPQAFTPGVKMPAFLPSDDSAPPDILKGDRQKQAEAIRDYLMSLE